MNGGSDPSHELPRVLTLRDLVLGQLLVVVGLNSAGTAAMLGESHRVLWIAGVLVFHLPLAAVVMRLGRERPIEGGIYEWARIAFGDTAGFLVGWNMWIFIVTFTSTLGLATSQAVSYAFAALGSSFPPMPPGLLHAGIMAVLTYVAVTGLGVGRWLYALGALLLPTLVAALALFAFTAPPVEAGSASGGAGSPLLSVVLFTKMTVYALAGLECLATLAGEARRPERDLPLSVAIVAPMTGLLYIISTDSVLRLVPAGSIDLVNPVAQAFSARAGAGWAAAAILALLARDLTQASLAFTAITRLPMVAGWEHQLPEWFARLDPVRRLPTRSILVAGAAACALGLAGGLGVGVAEAFQVLQTAAGLFFAATYLVLFAIPLFARSGSEELQVLARRARYSGFTRPPVWLRLAALSAFAVTALFMVLSVVPVVDVKSPLVFAAKVVGAFVGAQVLGVTLLRIGRKAAA